MARSSERMYIRMPQERADIIKNAADEAGITYTQFGGMLAWMGFRAYQRQVNPESLFTPEQLVSFAELYEQKQKENEPGDTID